MSDFLRRKVECIPILFIYPVHRKAITGTFRPRFQGLVASVDGSQIYRSSKVGALADAEKIGREAGENIKAEAGIEFFEWLQQQEEPAAVSA